jgi:hypothetical protein
MVYPFKSSQHDELCTFLCFPTVICLTISHKHKSAIKLAGVLVMYIGECGNTTACTLPCTLFGKQSSPRCSTLRSCLLQTPSAMASGVGRGRARGATCTAEGAPSATKVKSRRRQAPGLRPNHGKNTITKIQTTEIPQRPLITLTG